MATIVPGVRIAVPMPLQLQAVLECPNCGSTDYDRWTVIYEGTVGFSPRSVENMRVIPDFQRYTWASGHFKEINCGNCGNRWFPYGAVVDPLA